jgi:hypothetical protein
MIVNPDPSLDEIDPAIALTGVVSYSMKLRLRCWVRPPGAAPNVTFEIEPDESKDTGYSAHGLEDCRMVDISERRACHVDKHSVLTCFIAFWTTGK